jgi:hypothetical protein
VTIFHAYRAVDSTMECINDWRVDSRNAHGPRGNTARIYIRCPHDDSERSPSGYVITRMLAGFDQGRPWNGNWPLEWEGIQEFRLFIAGLFRQGYLNVPAFVPIVDNDMRGWLNPHGEMVSGMYPAPQFRREPGFYRRQGPSNIMMNPCKSYSF